MRAYAFAVASAAPVAVPEQLTVQKPDKPMSCSDFRYAPPENFVHNVALDVSSSREYYKARRIRNLVQSHI